MNSADPGSPRRRGPPRQAYQYVRPFAVTFAIPLRLTLTMTRLECRQFAIKVVLCRRLICSCGDDNAPRLGDFNSNPGNIHPSLDHGFDRPGHVLLPECGGRA